MNPPDDAIGPYRIIRELGSGGMSVVYLALDPRLDRHVAIKLLHADLDSPENRRRLLREARLAGSLSHRNIVTIFAVDEAGGHPYIVMEYVVGETLDKLIQSKVPFSIVRRLELMDDLCAGVVHAWQKLGMVHRDLKPSNLMVDRENVLRILDFGIARAAEAGSMSGTRIAGTPAYMAPEQIAGKAVDHRCDIFACGVVLYELLTYTRAFQAESKDAIFNRVLSQEPVPLLERDPALDPELARIVEHAIRKHPEDRYPDLQKMRDDLSRVRERLRRGQPVDTTGLPRAARGEPAQVAAATGGDLDGSLRAARADRVREHLQAASQALRQLDFAGAIEQAERALGFDPEHAEASQILHEATQQFDAQRIAGWLEQAHKYLGGGELPLAAELLAEAERLGAPGYEVKRLRRELDRAVAARDRHAERTTTMASTLDRARQALSSGDEAGAIQAAEAVLGLESAHAEARDLRARALAALSRRRRDVRHTEVAEQAIRSARELADQGAVELAAETLAAFRPEHPLVTELLAELRATAAARLLQDTERHARELRLTRALAAAGTALRARRWADAYDAASAALAVEPRHEEASRILSEADAALEAERQQAAWEERARLMMEDARTRAAAGSLEEAIDQLRGFSPAHEQVTALLRELELTLERKQRELAEREAKEVTERRAREQEERKHREQEQRRIRRAVTRAKQLAAQDQMERAVAALDGLPASHADVAELLGELRERLASERRAREEAERRAREEAERHAREEAERHAREEAERHAREEAERQAWVSEQLVRAEPVLDIPEEAEAPEPPPGRRGRSRAPIAAGLGIGAVAFLGGLWMLSRSTPAPVGEPVAIPVAVPSAPPRVDSPVTVRIDTEPPGATLTVEGRDGSWTTPAQVSVDRGTPLSVRVSRPGFQAVARTLSPKDLEAGSLSLVLEPVDPITVLLSGPYPFEVFDGRRAYPAQQRHRFTISEPRQLRLRSADYLLNRTITVNARPGQSFDYKVPAPGELSVRAPLLEQCRVTIGGQDLASPSFPPISRRRVAAGEHVVRLSCPDGRRIDRRVTVPPGGHETVIVR